MSGRMNDRHERFCNEMLVDMNATQAAIRAGYSEKTAGQIGSRLLKDVKIHARIDELRDKLIFETQITARSVLERLNHVANMSMQATPVMKFDPVSKMMVQDTDENGNGIYTFDSTGANRALELLGKHLGIFEKDNRQKKETQVQVFKLGDTEITM